MKEELHGNINFILVGARATGKSVYLTSLYLYSKHLTAQDKETIDYLKPKANKLEEKQYISATSGSLTQLIFNYKDKNITTSIEIDDVDGYFIETLSEEDKHTQNERNKLIENLKLSEGIIFFFPYQKENMHEKAIREFNYQIDTVISKLKMVCKNKSHLPIPVTIALSKWDESVDYQAEDEDEKVLKYINDNRILKLAKEKIENHFRYIQIIPISSTGKNFSNEPYNIDKPINFFIAQTYRVWEKEIDELDNNEEEQLIYLAKIVIDLESYKDGKYCTLYKNLEKKYASKFLNRVESIKNIKDYNIFYEKEKNIINALLAENREKIVEIGNRLKVTKKVKQFSGVSIAFMATGALVLAIGAWNAKNLLTKSEKSLYSDIVVEYKTHNYKQALEDINDYLASYSNLDNNTEHKMRVIEMKSAIPKEKIIDETDHIVRDSSYTNLNRIEEIFTSWSNMGIKNNTLLEQLTDKRTTIIQTQSFNSLKDNISYKNFQEAVTEVEENWKNEYNEDNRILIIRVLDRKYNEFMEKELKKIKKISNFTQYTKTLNSLNKMGELREKNIISTINYNPSLSSENKIAHKRNIKILESYQKLLNNGIKGVSVTFGTIREDNEPLGFTCDNSNESDIILNIDSTQYHYKTKDSCIKRKISWSPKNQVFKATTYQIEAIEEDTVSFNDKYKSMMKLNSNDLIQIYNGIILKQSINGDYFIELEKK